jgi:hypothetical protein
MVEMKRVAEARTVAAELGLLDGGVYFGDWVPYDEWPSYLAAAHVALSLHLDTLETRFAAIRSRIFGYLWAGLPMVVSEGDAAAALVSEHELGIVVPYEDVDAVASALLRLLAEGSESYALRFERVVASLTWERVAAPLLDFCAHPRRARDSEMPVRAVKQAQGATEARALEGQVQRQAEYIVALQQRLASYERGRFMSLMRSLHRARRSIGARIGQGRG